MHNFTHYVEQAWSEYDFEKNNYVPYGNVRSYVSQSSEVVNYINKYINKDTIFGSPKYSLKSCLLGVNAFRDKIASNMYDNPHMDTFCFTSHFDGKPKDIKVTSYYLNKFLPSLTMSLSKEFRDNLYDAFQIYNKFSDEMYDFDDALRTVCSSFEEYLMPLVPYLNYDKMTCSLFDDIYCDTENGDYHQVFDRFYYLCLWLLQKDVVCNLKDFIEMAIMREVHMQNINLDFDVVYEMMEIMKYNEVYNQKNNDNQ